MGVLNRKKFGAAGASGEEEKEFYSTAEATQLNTLLRGGQAQPPGASEGATGGSSAEVKTDSAGNETSNEQGQVRSGIICRSAMFPPASEPVLGGGGVDDGGF